MGQFACLRNSAESAHLAPVGYIVALELLRSFIWKLSKLHLESLFLACIYAHSISSPSIYSAIIFGMLMLEYFLKTNSKR